MKNVAIYARVSTLDKNDNLETQLLALREFVRSKGWEIYREYVDRDPANDLTYRTAWREMLDDAAQKPFQAVLVFKVDRAFRSTKRMLDTLSTLEAVGVSFVSVNENFDSSTDLGRLMLSFLGFFAELERKRHGGTTKKVIQSRRRAAQN